MANKRYRVLESTDSSFNTAVISGRNLSRSRAKALAKKEKGIYCGDSEGSVHRKKRKFIKGQHCYRLYSKMEVEN